MKVYLWRYLENEKNFPGHHIAGDEEGVVAMARQLRALQSGTASFELSPPTPEVLSVPNNLDGNAHFESYDRIVVEVVPTSNKNRKHFVAKPDAPAILFEASRAQVETFAKGIQGTKDGDIDFSMGGRPENQLWFW